MTTTAEFRRARARLAANARHHPDSIEDERQLLNTASRERKLRDVLGTPPEGTTWLDHFRDMAAKAPPLTDKQRETLALLLVPRSVPDTSP
jgi:hypothetical protein